MENKNVCINCLTNLYKNQNLLWADGKKTPSEKYWIQERKKLNPLCVHTLSRLLIEHINLNRFSSYKQMRKNLVKNVLHAFCKWWPMPLFLTFPLYLTLFYLNFQNINLRKINIPRLWSLKGSLLAIWLSCFRNTNTVSSFNPIFLFHSVLALLFSHLVVLRVNKTAGSTLQTSNIENYYMNNSLKST